MDDIVARLTAAPSRRMLYHFTRASNVPAIAALDALFASSAADPAGAFEDRTARRTVAFEGRTLTLNAHLRIPDAVMAPGTTQRAFFAYLDRHAFLWPTRSACRKMLDMYGRREPAERFAVLALEAAPFFRDLASRVKLSKYDSGSAPRFPHLCGYKKSRDMFLPLARFGQERSKLVPTIPSEVYEVLVERAVAPLFPYVRKIYGADAEELPPQWRKFAAPLSAF